MSSRKGAQPNTRKIPINNTRTTSTAPKVVPRVQDNNVVLPSRTAKVQEEIPSISENLVRRIIIGGIQAYTIHKYFHVTDFQFVSAIEAQRIIANCPGYQIYESGGYALIGSSKQLKVMNQKFNEMAFANIAEYLTVMMLACKGFITDMDIRRQAKEYYVSIMNKPIMQPQGNQPAFDPANFSPAIKFEFPLDMNNIKFSIITDAIALGIHDFDGCKKILEERACLPAEDRPKYNLALFDGVWIFSDLKRPNDINSEYWEDSRKNFIITKCSKWYYTVAGGGHGARGTGLIVEEYTRWLETQTSSEPRISIAPSSTSIISRDRPQNSASVGGIIPPEPVVPAKRGPGRPKKSSTNPFTTSSSAPNSSGAPDIERDPRINEEQEQAWAQETINNIVSSTQEWCNNNKKRNDLLGYLKRAAGRSDGTQGLDPRKTVYNLSTRRLIQHENKNARNLVFFEANGRALFGDEKPIKLAISLTNSGKAETASAIAWDPEDKQRSQSNMPLIDFLRNRVIQQAFNGIVNTCLHDFVNQIEPNESDNSSSASLSAGSSSRAAIDNNATFEQKVRLLDDMLGHEENIVQEESSFSVVYAPNEDIGFPPSIVARTGIQYEGVFGEDGAPSLPSIRRPRDLLAERVLELDDTGSRASVLEENIKEYQELMNSTPTTISLIRKQALQVQPVDVARSTAPFKVGLPSKIESSYLGVDLRIPGPPLQSRQNEMQQEDDDE